MICEQVDGSICVGNTIEVPYGNLLQNQRYIDTKKQAESEKCKKYRYTIWSVRKPDAQGFYLLNISAVGGCPGNRSDVYVSRTRMKMLVTRFEVADPDDLKKKIIESGEATGSGALWDFLLG
jgi:hypothetical protein